jgi:arabinose-5-phosphate isomerase
VQKSIDKLKELARVTLQTEADSITDLIEHIDDQFVNCVNHIFNSQGKVVVTGIGKSAIIASKIVATLNSTGTPSVFMHAADAIHGDIGTLQKEDTVICLSKSGNTPEIKILVPLLKRGGNKLVALVGNTDSFLAKQADYVLNATVKKEACPLNLAPTSSTTAQLALGDALAVCLLELRGFSSSDFAHYHPGGALGKKLYLKVSDIAKMNELPSVSPKDSIQAVIMEISRKRLGATAVTENNTLLGVITDGDLRRMLESKTDFMKLTAEAVMNKTPKTIEEDELAVNALALLQKHSILQLVVTNGSEYKGFIHMHDLLREGIL